MGGAGSPWPVARTPHRLPQWGAPAEVDPPGEHAARGHLTRATPPVKGKTMTVATTAIGQGWAPNVVSSFDADDMLKDALIVEAATLAGTVEGDTPSVLAPYVKTDAASAVVAEAGEITPTDGEYDQLAISTVKVAVITRVSRELTTQAGASERIAKSLRRSVTAKADSLFMANVSAPKGLLNVIGVPSAGDLGGSGSANLFAAFDAVAAIEADGGTASHVLIHPADWGFLCKLPEASGSNKSLLADVHDAANRSLAGVRVIVHPAVTQGLAVVLDKSEVLAAYGSLLLARSDDAYFSSDAVGIRATWRIGWNVVRPARLQTLTINGGA